METAGAPFYYLGLTLIPLWLSNHMPGKVWDEITYSFPNFIEVWEWISNIISLYNGRIHFITANTTDAIFTSSYGYVWE